MLHYTVVSSPAHRGALGTQIWIASGLTSCIIGNHTVSPRLTVVLLRVGCRTILVAAVHSPPDSSTDE
eukprot:6985743-Prorocentrum_lima.AAC.1